MPLNKKTAELPVQFAVVDLFAGPGGLAEGFSAVSDPNGNRPFKIVLSVEKEKAAHSPLLLRAFLRQFEGKFHDEYCAFLKYGTPEPDWAALYPNEVSRTFTSQVSNRCRKQERLQCIYEVFGQTVDY